MNTSISRPTAATARGERLEIPLGWAARLATPLVGVVALLVAYLAVALVLPAGGFFIADQGGKFLQIDALARTGHPSFGDVAAPLSVFRADFSYPFFYAIGSKFQVSFSPAYAMLVAPFYRLFGLRGVVLPSILGAVLAAYATARIAELLGARRPALVALTLGLATPLFFYSVVLWEHAISVGLLALGVYLALRRRMILAGLLVAAAQWFRPEMYLFAASIGLGLLLAFGLRSTFWAAVRYGIGFVVGTVPWWIYNLLTVGSILGLSAGTAARDYVGQVALAPSQGHPLYQLKPGYLVSLYFTPIGLKKWVILLAVMLVVGVVAYLRRRSFAGAFRFALPVFWLGVVVVGLLNWRAGTLGPPHSITDAFPFAFAALAPAALLSKDARVRFLWITTIAYLALASLLTLADPSNTFGGEWGPRYLLGIYPLLVPLAWLGFEATTARLGRAALVALLTFSLLVQVVGIAQLNGIESNWARLNRELLALPAHPIVTAVWYLPIMTSPDLRDLTYYGIARPGDLQAIPSGVTEFWWIWTPEPIDPEMGQPLQQTGALPDARFVAVSHQDLGVRGLQAVLYRVSP